MESGLKISCILIYCVRNGRDDRGRQVSSGVYIYRLRQGNVVVQKKMVLVR
jgi:hypothetical protein